jgi:uncharacterized protein YeaO (DUF488 family)
LRNWYGHDPEKWTEFKKRYWKELDRNPTLVSKLAEECRKDTVTFVFSSKEEKINNAVALREYIESSTGRIGRRQTGFTDRGTLK